MAEAVQAHDAIVRSAIERHGGYVSAGGGDGFSAAFSSAVDAVTAAVESQRELVSVDAMPFAVRMGLHTGEAVERDGNYYGTEVNRTGRLMALAHGGQVLVSDATEVLVRSQVALRPLADHLLRGLRGRIAVYQVLADGLRSEFPVLRSGDRFAGNLPRQVSSLVGRDKEVDDVSELVRSQRLVTLTGVGGVGKTRLAIEIGADLSGEFGDGVWIVELASVRDPGALPAALAAALGVTPQGDVPLIDTVANTLAGRRTLLVVDNCEHLRDAAAASIEMILGRAGSTKVLATSREAVGVPGEWVTAVSPLATEGGVTSDAVTLFVLRARSARPDFELQDPQTPAAVTEICETVDELPLGIELAAARMSAMSAIEVRDRLADRFRLLQGGEWGPERHLTLRHAVEWSYDLLTDDERALLRTASVFSGGFDLSTICAIVVDADEIEVLRNLDSLVRKSLVVADHIMATGADVVFNTIVPPGLTPFLAQVHDAGFTARGGQLVCTYFDENFLNLVPAEHVEGLYGCLDYYRGVQDPFSIELLNRYEARYPGSAMFTAGSACTGTYRALKMWETAANEAGSLKQHDVIAALDHARIPQGPGGPAEMVPGQHHVRMNMYIARSESGTFKVVENLGHIDPKECEVPVR
jgi:predicted ATPase